jgi:tyrosine-protein kinase Etk/Wzc
MIAADQPNGRRDPDSFDVRASVRAIWTATRDNMWLVIITTILVLAGTTAYIVIWPPVFRATALLMVERDTDPIRDGFYLGWNVFRKDDARTEIELMTAGPVLAEVVRTENLTFDDVYHSFGSHAAHLWGESWIGQRYRAIKAKIFPEPPSDGAPSEEDIEFGKVVVNLASGVSIMPVAESNVGRLTVRGPSRRVAEVANTLAETYLQQRTQRHYDEAEKSYEILTIQVDDVRSQLKEVEDRRLAFSNDLGLAFDFQKEALEVSKLTDLEERVSTSAMGIAVLEASLAEVKSQLRNEPPEMTTATSFQLNTVRETLKQKRLELQTDLIRLRHLYREDAPEVQEVKEDLAAVEKMIAEASEMIEAGSTTGLNVLRSELLSRRNRLQSELEGARAGHVVLVKAAAALEERLAAVPAGQLEMRRLDREYAVANEKYTELLAKQAQAEVSLTVTKATMPSMRIVERAVPPAKKSWPRTKILYPAALVVGLFMGVALAVARSYTAGGIRSDHIDQGRFSAPLYGTIRVATRGRPLAATPGEVYKSASLGTPPRAGST